MTEPQHPDRYACVPDPEHPVERIRQLGMMAEEWEGENAPAAVRATFDGGFIHLEGWNVTPINPAPFEPLYGQGSGHE